VAPVVVAVGLGLTLRKYTVETVTYLSNSPVLGECIERAQLPLSLLVTSLGYLTLAKT